MIKVKNILVILALSAFWGAPYSWAGGHIIGNGGYVLKCESAKGVVIKSFDLVEGEIMYDQVPLYSSQKNFKEKAKEIINRIKKHNPSRVELYLGWLKNFEKELRFLPSGVNLVDIPDVSIGILPQACQLKQAIVQTSQPVSNQPRYLINSDLWNAMTEDTKAALVVHEIIYREAIQVENRHLNSFYVRQFNQWLHADKLSSLSLKDYISFLRERFFAQADAHGISIILFNFHVKTDEIQPFPVEFWNEGVVKSATVYWRGSFESKGIRVSYQCWPHVYHMVHDPLQVVFYSNRQIKNIEFPVVENSRWDQELSCSAGTVDLTAFGFKGRMKANIFEFSEEGQLQKATASRQLNGDLLEFFSSGMQWNISKVKGSHFLNAILIPFERIVFAKDVCSEPEKTYLIYENGQRSENIIREIRPGEAAPVSRIDFCPKT